MPRGELERKVARKAKRVVKIGTRGAKAILAGFEVSLGNLEAFGVCLVEFRGILAYRGVSPGSDSLKDRRDGFKRPLESMKGIEGLFQIGRVDNLDCAHGMLLKWCSEPRSLYKIFAFLDISYISRYSLSR